MCVLSTWFGDICGSRKHFCMFYKRSRSLISNSIRCGCLRTDQCNIACPKAEVNRNALAIDRRSPLPPTPPSPPPPPPPPPPLRGGDELCRVISAVRVCRCRRKFTILCLDTLCSKKWCGIHLLQWSTIPRIGRHSAGYS